MLHGMTLAQKAAQSHLFLQFSLGVWESIAFILGKLERASYGFSQLGALVSAG